MSLQAEQMSNDVSWSSSVDAYQRFFPPSHAWLKAIIKALISRFPPESRYEKITWKHGRVVRQVAFRKEGRKIMCVCVRCGGSAKHVASVSYTHLTLPTILLV